MKVEVENSDAAPIPGVFHTAYWVATILRISGYKANTRITFMRIRIRLFTSIRIRVRLFISMRIRNLLLIRVMRICDHSLHFEPMNLLNFDFSADPDPQHCSVV